MIDEDRREKGKPRMLLWGDSAKRGGGGGCRENEGVWMRGEGMLDLLPYNGYSLEKEEQKA